VYVALVVCLILIQALLKAYLGVPFRSDEVLECIYGPAIMLATTAVIFGLVYVLLGWFGWAKKPPTH
jgi:hypothetical protein